MKEITLTVERDEESGWHVASWDAPPFIRLHFVHAPVVTLL